MNGLKKINDENDHDAGDLALKTFFQCVLKILREKGDGYRMGGDEVLVLLPNHGLEKAKSLFKKLCQTVMNENPIYQRKSLGTLSLSVGIACTDDPEIGFKEFQNSADKQMYRAKEKVKKNSNISCAIACNGETSIELWGPSLPSQ
jgi:diguanylate cyclase